MLVGQKAATLVLSCAPTTFVPCTGSRAVESTVELHPLMTDPQGNAVLDPKWAVIRASVTSRDPAVVVHAPVSADSNPSTLPDAPVPDAALPPADAAIAVDAFVPQDAPPSVFCTENFQCTASGECCITLGGPMSFCGSGTIILDECFPQ